MSVEKVLRLSRWKMRAEGGASKQSGSCLQTAMTDRKPAWKSFARRLPGLLAAAAMAVICRAPAAIVADAAAPLFSFDSANGYAVAPPLRFADHILLVSTREIGDRCDDAAMQGLRYEEYMPPFEGAAGWRPLTAAEAAGELAQPMPTVVYLSLIHI